ncbi:hypothetical protein PAAG_02385 [Paracoccidioides lutzii Pb01]|uniref:Uncharacterized protein n=1 Tax=Paracoccidioides lutzii (strain ATCC MYA-826 / Pb01) TaxID=502779 RepID=C1GUR2_PARBA|nr:hypothetical protein PAAG_02385 [Paracoccidioides lutzii Pb01]EEH40330.2 hypothetical protein PAAG_02385 [Paracoccidioides lutzii Pb01]
MANMVVALRALSSTSKPIHRITGGPKLIRLAFPEPVSNFRILNDFVPDILPSSVTRYPAVFSVHISKTLSDDEITELVKWIKEIGKGRGFAVNGAYRTNSTVVILETPYSVARTPVNWALGTLPNILVLEAPREVYAQLRNIPGVNVIFEDMSSNNLASSPSATELPVAAHEEFLRELHKESAINPLEKPPNETKGN